MKKIISLIPMFIVLASFGQDSSKLKVSAQIQARDLEYITQFIYNRDGYEEMFDNLKAKFRTGTPPTGATIVTVDTVALGLWADIHNFLKGDPFAKNTFNRVNTILTALGQSWLTARINEQEAYFNDRQNSLQQFGRQRLRKQQN